MGRTLHAVWKLVQEAQPLLIGSLPRYVTSHGTTSRSHTCPGSFPHLQRLLDAYSRLCGLDPTMATCKEEVQDISKKFTGGPRFEGVCCRLPSTPPLPVSSSSSSTSAG